jgi:hypothetical protein
MGFLSALGKIGGFAAKLLPIPGAGLIGDAIGAAGDMASAGSQAAAHNRGTKLDAQLYEEQANQARQQNFIDQLAQRAQEGRASGTDAWKKLQQAEYLGTATEGYKPKNGLPSYGFGPKAATESERLGAASMRDESLQRFREGNSIPEIKDPGQFRLDPKNLNAGMWEKLGGILGPGLSTFGALGDRNGRGIDIGNGPPIMTMDELAKLGIYDEQI